MAREDKTTKSIAVLGLGKFGKSLAKNLYDQGADVLVVDDNQDEIDEATSYSTCAICANLNNEEEVSSLGLEHMDIVISAMGSNLAASILCVSEAKEKGVAFVGAKTNSDRMSAILRKVGADQVIDPEEDGGKNSARYLLSNYVNDGYQLDDNLYVFQIRPKEEWIGKSLVELDLRKSMNINVIGTKIGEEEWRFVDINDKIQSEWLILIATDRADF